MRQYKKILIISISIIILANTPPIYYVFKIFLDERHYRYSNYNGSFTFTEFMGMDFEMMKRSHKGYLLHNPYSKDERIYRVFTKNPLTFWRWRLYFFDERYKLPYKDFEEIKKIRE